MIDVHPGQILIENQIKDEADDGNECEHHYPCKPCRRGLSLKKQDCKDKYEVYRIYDSRY
jgi:hypothetical protein